MNVWSVHVPLRDIQRLVRRALWGVLLAVVCGVEQASAVPAESTEINICNRGNVDVLVASFKVYDTFRQARAWIVIGPGECENVHYETVGRGLVHINEAARVNLAFMTRDRKGVLRPYLGSFGYDPDGTKYRPRILCLPHWKPGDRWTVDTNFADGYLPPCGEGVPIVPVSFSAYIQGAYHLTLDVTPER